MAFHLPRVLATTFVFGCSPINSWPQALRSHACRCVESQRDARIATHLDAIMPSASKTLATSSLDCDSSVRTVRGGGALFLGRYVFIDNPRVNSSLPPKYKSNVPKIVVTLERRHLKVINCYFIITIFIYLIILIKHS